MDTLDRTSLTFLVLTVTSLALSQAYVAVQQKVTQHHHAAKQGSVKVELSQSLDAHQRGRKKRRGRLSLPVKAKSQNFDKKDSSN